MTYESEADRAAAWRARSDTHGITVDRRPDKLTVRVNGTPVGTFRVTYKAHAYAEQLARSHESTS